jgi:hypothetical protein
MALAGMRPSLPQDRACCSLLYGGRASLAVFETGRPRPQGRCVVKRKSNLPELPELKAARTKGYLNVDSRHPRRSVLEGQRPSESGGRRSRRSPGRLSRHLPGATPARTAQRPLQVPLEAPSPARARNRASLDAGRTGSAPGAAHRHRGRCGGSTAGARRVHTEDSGEGER